MVAKKSTRNLRRTAIFALSTCAIMAAILAFVPLGGILAVVRRLHPTTIIAVLAISTVFNAFVYTDRWRRALRCLGVSASFSEMLKLVVGLGPLRFFFPFQTGELLTGALLAQRIDAPLGPVISTLVYNKFLTFIATFLLLVIGVLAGGLAQSPFMWAAAVAGALILVLFLVLENRHGRRVVMRLFRRMGRSPEHLMRGLLSAFEELPIRAKLGLLLYSVFFQFSEVIVCYLLFRDLGIHLPFAQLIVTVQLMILVSSLPISLAGLGAREGAALALLASAAAPEAAVAAGMTYSFFEYLWPLIMGLPLTWSVSGEALSKARAALARQNPADT